MLGRLVLVDHLAKTQSDLVWAHQASFIDGGGDRCEDCFPGDLELGSFAFALFGQERVSTRNEAFCGVVTVSELR